MNLIAFDFWSILLIAIGLFLLAIGYRLVWVLARLSDGLIGFLTHLGLKPIAKMLLTILVDYDQQTYRKSRFIVWNQVPFRFALLWSTIIGVISLLFILKMGRSIHSVGQTFALIVIIYIGYRCLMYWTGPRRNNFALNSRSQEVKEQQSTGYLVMRRWDYLDELFTRAS